jgi:ParB family chromosome partitioning protein
MAELVESIRKHGVLQPVLVRRAGDDYELVAGERRWRAAMAAGLKSLPAVIRECTDRQLMEMALVENLQREDLNAIEEAAAYRLLLQEFTMTQEDIAERVGKSRPHVANTLRLLQLPAEVQDLIREGRLSAGHGRALMGLSDGSLQRRVAERALTERLSVRQLEELVQALSRRRERKQARSRTPELAAIEDRLQELLGTKVRISGERRGRVEIRFYSSEDLERIVDLLLGVSVGRVS